MSGFLKMLLAASVLVSVLSVSAGNVSVKEEGTDVILSNEYYRIVVDCRYGGRIKSLRYLPSGQELIPWKERIVKKTGEIRYEGGFLRVLPYGAWPGVDTNKPFEFRKIKVSPDEIKVCFSRKIEEGRLSGNVINNNITINNSRKIEFCINIENQTGTPAVVDFKMHNEVFFGNEGNAVYLIPSGPGLETIKLDTKNGLPGNYVIDHKGSWQGILDLERNEIFVTSFSRKPAVVSTLFWLESKTRSYEWMYEQFTIDPGKSTALDFSLDILPLDKNWKNLTECGLLTEKELCDLRENFLKEKAAESVYRPSEEDRTRGFFVAVKDKNKKYFGNESVLKDEVGIPLRVKVAQGEITGTTFVIEGTKDVRIDSIETGDKEFGGNDRIDFRIVKVWWQGPSLEKQFKVPELLLHDDSIIEVAEKKNELKFKGDLPYDPEKLQPFNVKNGEFRQIWVTVKTPENQKPGIYKGKIFINSGDRKAELPFEIEVYPFKLMANKRIAGLFVQQRLDTPESVMEREKTGYEPLSWSHNCPQSHLTDSLPKEKYKDMVKVLKDYGMRDNVIYSGNTVGGELDIYKEVFGDEFDKATFVFMNPYGADKYRKEKGGKFGLAAWCSDEPGVAQFPEVRKKAEKLHSRNFQVAVTMPGQEADKSIGDVVDFPIYCIESAVPFIGKLAEKNHSIGRRTMGYFQCWQENYLQDRVIFGLYFWKSGYDGIMSYVFMDIKAGKQPGPMAYDETNAEKYKHERNLMMVYPAKNGFIPTLQFEGVRDGINDIRYIGTLEQLIESNKSKNVKVKETKEAEEFLKKLRDGVPATYSSIYNAYSEKDFENIRSRISEWIKRLGQD